MPQNLHKETFTEDHWDEVQTFDCGSEVYELEVSDWLKRPLGQDSALTAIRLQEKPAKVWLYKLADGTLVGSGAISESEWRWTGKKDPRIPLTIIIWLAVDKRFQGQPEGPREERYSYQIIDDLIAEAVESEETRPIVGLCVHADNLRAIALYRQYGFTNELDTFKDKETGHTYLRMALILNEEVLLQIRDSLKKRK